MIQPCNVVHVSALKMVTNVRSTELSLFSKNRNKCQMKETAFVFCFFLFLLYLSSGLNNDDIKWN